jgi:hypothetical protein
MENSTALATLSCPLGGFLSVCYEPGQSQFIGCCDGDACGPAGCSDGNLRSTSFTPDLPIVLQDQKCETGKLQFWTCNQTSPPFWGCCAINPCQSNSPHGCPSTSLIAALIKNETGNPFIPSSQSSVPTGVSHSSIPSGAIVGGVLGGLAVLGVILTAIFLRSRRSKKTAQQNGTFVDAKDLHEQTYSTMRMRSEFEAR